MQNLCLSIIESMLTSKKDHFNKPNINQNKGALSEMLSISAVDLRHILQNLQTIFFTLEFNLK